MCIVCAHVLHETGSTATIRIKIKTMSQVAIQASELEGL